MSKLLSGQQLYMSTHIHNQILAEGTPEPQPPHPPFSRSACLVATTNGRQPYYTTSMGLGKVGSSAVSFLATRLDEVSWVFGEIPDRYFPAFVNTNWPGYEKYYPYHVASYDALQRIHYCRCLEPYNGYPCKSSVGGFFCDTNWGNNFKPLREGSDWYECMGRTYWGDIFYVAIEVEQPTPTIRRHRIAGYFLPLSTSLELYTGFNYPPWDAKISRDAEGNYGFSFHDPNWHE